MQTRQTVARKIERVFVCQLAQHVRFRKENEHGNVQTRQAPEIRINESGQRDVFHFLDLSVAEESERTERGVEINLLIEPRTGAQLIERLRQIDDENDRGEFLDRRAHETKMIGSDVGK